VRYWRIAGITSRYSWSIKMAFRFVHLCRDRQLDMDRSEASFMPVIFDSFSKLNSCRSSAICERALSLLTRLRMSFFSFRYSDFFDGFRMVVFRLKNP